MHLISQITLALAWFLIIASVMGAVYQVVAAFAVQQLARQPMAAPVNRPPVTILKPLCGLEMDLYRNLRSFCELRYPTVQIVFGVRDPNDPAIRVVEQLRADLPGADIALVVNENVYGTNYKVSNLINMMEAAKYDLLVLSDSDMQVEPGISRCHRLWARAAGRRFGHLPVSGLSDTRPVVGAGRGEHQFLVPAVGGGVEAAGRQGRLLRRDHRARPRHAGGDRRLHGAQGSAGR